MQLAPGDIPAPGDYLGTGQTQVAVYRPSTASFIVYSGAAVAETVPFGKAGYIPSPRPLAYRNVFHAAGDYNGGGKTDPALFERVIPPAGGLVHHRHGF